MFAVLFCAVFCDSVVSVNGDQASWLAMIEAVLLLGNFIFGHVVTFSVVQTLALKAFAS